MQVFCSLLSSRLGHSVSLHRGIPPSLLLACSLSALPISTAFALPITESAWQTQIYAPAPADNPLKGLVPYAGAANPDKFPHSMEFSYFPLSAVVVAPERYDFAVLERFLDAVAARGHQAVFRFYLEYPNKQDGIPGFLLDAGLKTTRFERTSTPPRPPATVMTPDYEDARLRQMLRSFISAFGARYDGDKRIGFITAGLLGLWGEWHDSPRNDLFASKVVQNEVMQAYASAFHSTPILLRYPAGEQDAAYASNATAPFGYHDDSFAWATLGEKNWSFMNRMRAAGGTALTRWQSSPIGGEIRPEAWGKVFDTEPANPNIENFRQCVAVTHASWLMDSGMFRAGNSGERRQRAIEEVRRMGYEFHVASVALEAGESPSVALKLENRGVAPFYYAWPMEFALLNDRGRLRSTPSSHTLQGILPGEARLIEQRLDRGTLTPGRYRLLMRVANSLPEGKSVHFANTRQDADLDGWLSLGEVVLQ